MIYLRKIFKQDLREGKQIAFPKEASNIFFNFNYQNNAPERLISFNYKQVNGALDTTIIDTRLYSAGSESRIDSDLKRFLIDKLDAQIDDVLIFTKIDDAKYDFQFLSKKSDNYDFIFSLLGKSNHQVVVSDQSENNINQPINNANIEDNSLRGIVLKTFNFLLSNFGEEKVLSSSSKRESKLDDKVINVLSFPDYFKSDSIISYFDEKQNKEDFKTSNNQRYFDENLNLKEYKYSYLINQWYDSDTYNTSLNNFNRFLFDKSEESLKIIKENDMFKLIFSEKNSFILSESRMISINKIYFGPPGTGKSHAIKEELKKLGVKPENYSRVTFHPDYDYHSFVGGYKPVNEGDIIKYKFVPQVFTDLYVKAWNNQNENYYLVIEEINRGNCAEIFGDIFQLLDRNPEYNIEPSTELREYLEGINKKRKSEGQDETSLLFDGKLQMPDNLSVMASMNTSDQSLYPMDSAFKRRWDWHYIPIDLNCHDSDFTIEIDDSHKYSWLQFLDKINTKIYNVTKSEDKQLGNWFINAAKSDNIISKELFINKVLFYLWNDIFKDEIFNPDNVFIERDDKGTKVRDISFNNFYNKKEQEYLLIHLLEDILGLGVLKNKEVKSYIQDDVLNPQAAEEIGNVLNNDTDTE